jgi:hypothetical protein
MKLKIDTTGMTIIPESPQDEIYLESMYDLKKSGDQIVGKRANASSLSCWYGIEFKRKRE